MKFAFIINPHSAKGDASNFLGKLKKKLENPYYIISQSMADTEQFITENWDKIDIFVAVGGDGTISSVAKKLVNTEKILAIYPAGSGNGFANENSFTKDIDQLITKLKNHQYREIDTLLINNNLSINVSGVGFDGAVAQEFEKTSRGFANYAKVVAEIFNDFQPIKVKFQDEYQQYNDDYLMINFANTKQFGNNAYIAPHAEVSDGLVDIVLVKKFPITHAIPFAYKMFSKELKENEYVKFLSVSEIEFSVDTDIWHIDGDFIAIPSPVKVKVLPKSLKILS